jgi:two-component system cell cycle sensor histidine kinase PleC
VSLTGIAQDCMHLLTIRAQKREIRMIEMMEPNLPRIWVDERAVRQVTLNLLTNAIKFTPQGGQVTAKVGWTSAGGQYLAIKDTGPGIPEAQRTRIFEKFHQIDSSTTREHAGTGLGLAIVQSVVSDHGGKISVESEHGAGATFRIELPVQQRNARPAASDSELPPADPPLLFDAEIKS